MGEVKKIRELAPFGDKMQVMDEIDRFFERFLGPERMMSHLPVFRWPMEVESAAPRVDIYEDEEHVFVKAEMPGMRKEDIEIEVMDNQLSIKGTKTKEEKIERKDYYRMERTEGAFSRQLMLPAEVSPRNAKATFKDGILQVELTKTSKARNKVKIELK